MARITRKELKSDKFALEVGHTVDFFEEHREQIVKYAAIAAGIAVLAFAFLWYSRHQHAVRQEALSQAIQAMQAPVGANANGPLSFPTEEAKQQEATKRFSLVASKYSGSDEAFVAKYYLGSIAADAGKLAEAEKQFKDVADNAGKDYASLAKLSLAQIYFTDGRAAEGEKMLRSLMEHPTLFVTKEHATIALARSLAPTKPAEARKLLEPLRTQPGAASQVAITLYGEIPAQ